MIEVGTRLGPYEVLAPLGSGAMGEVYRARDTRLERTVAIKILPAHLSSDPAHKQRFEREAKIISSLNHPHICVLHDVGRHGELDYLVMECLEGETLADRLNKGPLPLNQVLKFGMQLADALDKAHRSGVVHRDLKPGNIMLTPTGAKLLDFGLAKPTARLASLATGTTAAVSSSSVTEQGMIVGTSQYMSPEQIEGKDVDGRSDIFSFGSVLYEMITGQRAFQGNSRLSVASAILEQEPEPISVLKPMSPPALDQTIRRCLAKDREERWQAARDLQLELKWIAEAGSQSGIPAQMLFRRKLSARIAWALLVAVTPFAVWKAFLPAPKSPEPVRLSADLGADAALITEYGPAVILSPDGTRLVFVAFGADRKIRLYIRALDGLQAAPLSGTDGARDPFFSPDGQWIAFFADGKLKKISVQGGAVVTLCDVPADRGGSWSEDGSIIFTPKLRAALSKVPAAGGTPEPLTELHQQAGESTERWPQALRGGKGVLFTSDTNATDFDNADIVVYSMATGKRKTIVHGASYARILPDGHLVYTRQGTLFGAPFDLKRMEITGQAVPVLEDVVTNPQNGGAQFSFSNAGSLVYVPGTEVSLNVAIYWMDREGKFKPLREVPDSYNSPAFSPDGKQLAVSIGVSGKESIWVYDLLRDTLSRLTLGGQASVYPVWTPEGQRIVYAAAEKDGTMNLYWKRADGSDDAQRLTASKKNQYPFSWSPDGKTLAFAEDSTDSPGRIMTVSVEGDDKSGWKFSEPRPFLNSPFLEWAPAFSPDGRWLAYRCNESGSDEVYVRPFPGPAGKWQVSSEGGGFPRWSRSKRELFYKTPDQRIMVVSYTEPGGSFQAERPQLWSPGQFTDRSIAYNFDLHPDGKRFAVLKASDTGSQVVVSKVNFVFNFFQELRRKIPSGL